MCLIYYHLAYTSVNFITEIMPPKPIVADDLIIALRDARVIEALGNIFETKLLSVVAELKEDNVRKTDQIKKLQHDLQSATTRIEALESYTRRDNLLISGLAPGTFAEAAATENPDDIPRVESSDAVELNVLKLFNEQLGVPVKPSDISIAHRLPKRPNVPGPSTVMVRFANRRTREAVYPARRNLRSFLKAIYINEDLNKSTTELFRQARQLVKSRQIGKAWTAGCVVYIKEADPRSRPKRVLQLSDLPAPVAH